MGDRPSLGKLDKVLALFSFFSPAPLSILLGFMEISEGLLGAPLFQRLVRRECLKQFLDPRQESLQRLLKKLHENGMRGMADIVINHRCGDKQDSQAEWVKIWCNRHSAAPYFEAGREGGRERERGRARARAAGTSSPARASSAARVSLGSWTGRRSGIGGPWMTSGMYWDKGCGLPK